MFGDSGDRDQAAALVGAELGIRRSELPDTEEGSYYWSDLEGLTVETTAGKALGQVAYLLETGADDVLVVRREGGETLIPFVNGQVVRKVDLEKGVICVDWEWD